METIRPSLCERVTLDSWVNYKNSRYAIVTGLHANVFTVRWCYFSGKTIHSSDMTYRYDSYGHDRMIRPIKTVKRLKQIKSWSL